ncbi:MAG: glycosyltransferase [Mariprofundaceae bacterium]|nr:glycosyltransferase [Mariprofundaceae bacterium]
MSSFLHRYLERYAANSAQVIVAPQPELGLIIVIPCQNEPNILKPLHAILACQKPPCAVEIIVVINAGSHDEVTILAQNNASLRTIEQADLNQDHLQIHAIHVDNLAKKHAGVGLARKLGMDEAIRRFVFCGKKDGIIVSLDADCDVHGQYLVDIWQHFQEKQHKACVIPFQHDTQGMNTRHKQAIQLYEIDILYHVQGLKLAQYPHAFHTIGSCFAVSAHAYAAQGGMNRRQAGEDFYFLHKVADLGDVATLRKACVYPSSRISFRVPFGTGQALQTWIQDEHSTRMVTHPKVYQDLACLFSQLDLLFSQEIVLPIRLENFLANYGFREEITDMRQRVSNTSTFKKRFLRWFSALRIRQYITDCADHIPLEVAANELLSMSAETPVEGIEALLIKYRHLSWGSL